MSKIIFVLSYMTEGQVGMWADAFMEKVLREGSRGTWHGFTEKLSAAFQDMDKARRSLKVMDKLQQGKGSTAKYFFKLEQLAYSAGVPMEDSLYVIMMIKRGLDPGVVNSIYQGTERPEGYIEEKAIGADELWR
jgi:hypothetical protein